MGSVIADEREEGVAPWSVSKALRDSAPQQIHRLLFKLMLIMFIRGRSFALQ